MKEHPPRHSHDSDDDDTMIEDVELNSHKDNLHQPGEKNVEKATEPSVVTDDMIYYQERPESSTPKVKPFGIMGSIIGECLCEPFLRNKNNQQGGQQQQQGLSPSAQYVQLQGIQYIGLGAVVDELTPKERVYDTLEQLTSRTSRMISIGYIVDNAQGQKVTEAIPLELWQETYPNDRNMSRSVKRTIASIQAKQYGDALNDFRQAHEQQKKYPLKQYNHYMVGITAHNMGVVCVLAGRHQIALPMFEEAVSSKRLSFGPDHPEVAVSLCEQGIQLFERERFDEALAAFKEGQLIYHKAYGPQSPKQISLLNNIACCLFQMKDPAAALETLHQARELQDHRNSSNNPAKSDLDLLQKAILLSNDGYLRIQQKQYDNATACFEEALLVRIKSFGVHVRKEPIPRVQYPCFSNSLLTVHFFYYRFNSQYWGISLATEPYGMPGRTWNLRMRFIRK